MHREKAAFLAEITSDSRDNDREIREQLAILVRPDRHGLAASVAAGLEAAMNISSAIMLDIAELAASRIDDTTWDQIARDRLSSEPPPNEEL
jgi:hypothetical protein